MRWICAAILALTAQAALACDARVCQVDPDSLALTQLITFEDQRASFGPGILLDDLFVLSGAAFGEHFLGQTLEYKGNHDAVRGAAIAPLTLATGAPGQSMSLVIMGANKVLNGYGPAGFPRRAAQGEGAIAVLFERDQAALAFDLRGGEGGTARVMFLRRDGSIIADVPVRAVREYAVGFQRAQGSADIAGFVLMNVDPQGLAIDNLRFEHPKQLS